MKGIILVNAYSNYGSYREERLFEEFKFQGIDVEIMKNEPGRIYIDRGKIINKYKCDFVVYLDKDKYIGKLLEKDGIRVFNKSHAIEICDDKFMTFIELLDQDILFPKTISGPFCPIPKFDMALDNKNVAKILDLPMILKECHGSMGGQVYKVENKRQMDATVKKICNKQFLYQQEISENVGTDVRAIVIGKKFCAAMLRQNFTDFRSNVACGGEGTPFAADARLIEICEKIATLLDLDYCGIDLFITDEDYLLCEVNSNAFFQHFEKVTDFNVARAYVKHIASVMQIKTTNGLRREEEFIVKEQKVNEEEIVEQLQFYNDEKEVKKEDNIAKDEDNIAKNVDHCMIDEVVENCIIDEEDDYRNSYIYKKYHLVEEIIKNKTTRSASNEEQKEQLENKEEQSENDYVHKDQILFFGDE